MILFAFAAGVMVVILLRAAWERPRPAVILAAILWLLYGVYEHQVATGVLCEAPCNIRVDLALFFPILAAETFCAYRSYMGLPSGLKVLGIVVGGIGLFIVLLLVEDRGYPAWIGAVAALAIGAYFAIKRSRRKTKSETHPV